MPGGAKTIALPGHADLCVERANDIASLKLAIFGDGNGNKGLIRRVDSLAFIKLQNWIIIALLSPIIVNVILSWLK